MCYSNPTIVNMYIYYCKFVYKIIVNGGGYRITYFIGRDACLCLWVFLQRLVVRQHTGKGYGHVEKDQGRPAVQRRVPA